MHSLIHMQKSMWLLAFFAFPQYEQHLLLLLLKEIYYFCLFIPKGVVNIMKLICQREHLLNAINMVSKAVSSRTTLPILECILLTVKEDSFKLTGNDLELGIESASIEATIQESGSVALDAKLFSEIIRKAEGEMVGIKCNNKFETVITCGSSKFRISGQSGEDYPSLPEVEKNNEIKVSQKDLRDMIRQTIFSIAQEDNKPILTGELIEIKDDKMNMVSVDGYRISLKQVSISPVKDSIHVVVPGKSLNEISKILSTDEGNEAVIYFTDKHILFDLGSSIVISRLLEGDFIKYEQSFTADYKTKIRIKRLDLIAGLERASLVSRDLKKTPVKMEISDRILTLSAQGEMGTSNEELAIDIDGDNLEIGFNPKFLIDALKVMEEESVTVQFTTPLSPCIIKSPENSSYKYLVLPLRM